VKTLEEVLKRLSEIAPEKVRSWQYGAFVWRDANGDRCVRPAEPFTAAAITHLMFSEMREAWDKGTPRTRNERPLIVLRRWLFSGNCGCLNATDELIWETYLAWMEAQAKSLTTVEDAALDSTHGIETLDVTASNSPPDSTKPKGPVFGKQKRPPISKDTDTTR
jgi:hypothetical protein